MNSHDTRNKELKAHFAQKLSPGDIIAAELNVSLERACSLAREKIGTTIFQTARIFRGEVKIDRALAEKLATVAMDVEFWLEYQKAKGGK